MRERSERISDTSDPITVLVVDDHDLLREGVSSCLSAFDDLEVIGESASGEEGLEAAVRLRPDVVVIDLIMPGMGGVEAIRQMRAADDSIGLLALSTFANGELIREAIGAGASGYLVKSVDTEGLAQAVRDVAAGPRLVLVATSPGCSPRRRPSARESRPGSPSARPRWPS